MLLLSAVVLLSVTSAAAQGKKSLTFDQIFKDAEPRLLQQLPSISGWFDDENYIEMKRKEGERRGAQVMVNVKTGQERPYHDLSQYQELAGKDFDLSSPASFNDAYTCLIFQKDKDLYYLSTEKKQFRRLTESSAEEKNPTLSPDAKAVAFTRENNLFSVDLESGKETQYTSDGTDLILNGWASWVYFEEIFGRASRYRAFWWSTDSKLLAFYRFDDSRVPMFPLYSSEGQHGFIEKEHYPKVGDPNPEVKIGFVRVGEAGRVVWADFDEKRDQYFGTPFWTPDGKLLLVQWMNRGQDTLKLIAVGPEGGTGREIYEEYQPSWVEWFDGIKFLDKGREFILKTDKDGWSHLYLHSMGGKLKTRLTEGKWAVADLEVVNEEKGLVYFTAKKENSTRTDLYSIGLDGKGMKRLTSGEYNHSIMVSPGGSYFITRFSNVSTPSRLALYSTGGGLVRDLGDSRTKEFDNFTIAKTELLRIPTEDGYELPMTITLPAGLDPARKYPVLIEIYGGPGAGTVSDSWRGLGSQWWAMEGIIQVAVDHRGSGHFGKEGMALMHRNLGKWEMHDYIAAVKWLRTKSYVDSTRVCITGGSYGGYVTALALTYGADYFTHGIASSSVIDWQLYDSHYVERYMDSKEENPEGYKFGSVLTHAEKYKGLLQIVHGSMDDNVHMQNSIQLVDRLEDLGKHFELMIYPGGRHGWGGAKAVHSRNETYRFYYKYLLGKDFPEDLFKNMPPRRRF
jgi:dipeptidyl-peptidase-4